MKVKVLKNILDSNVQIATKNQALFNKNNVLTLNIMASPGAGKTSLILKTIDGLKDFFRIAVIEGDIASTIDADRIGEEGVDVIQINTDGGCHLDANMIANALESFNLADLDILLIENVGNLVCPAGFHLGEQRRIVLASIPEGDDKPHKYPNMFADTEVVIITKTDLLPYLKFNLQEFERTVKGLNPKVQFFKVSSHTGEGFDEWLEWLKQQFAIIKK
jgi:hydrogenase nickel incorporation protein HypB